MIKAGLKAGLLFLVMLSSAQAGWVHDVKVTHILSEHVFEGNMIRLNKPIGQGCPDYWLALDNKGHFRNKEIAKQQYALALSSANNGNKMNVYVYPHWRIRGYCVASRIDLLAR